MSEQIPKEQQGDSDKSGDPRERNLDSLQDEKRLDRIYDDVIATITRLNQMSPTDLMPTTDIMYDLGLDSLQVYELVVDLEEAYDIRLPDEDLERLHTVQDIVDLVYSMAH